MPLGVASAAAGTSTHCTPGKQGELLLNWKLFTEQPSMSTQAVEPEPENPLKQGPQAMPPAAVVLQLEFGSHPPLLSGGLQAT